MNTHLRVLSHALRYADRNQRDWVLASVSFLTWMLLDAVFVYSQR